jgi:hypothetical protein
MAIHAFWIKGFGLNAAKKSDRPFLNYKEKGGIRERFVLTVSVKSSIGQDT